MQSFPTDDPARSPLSRRQIHPALTSFADEVCATLARLFVYVGALALFGILGIHAWDQLRLDLACDAPPARLERRRPVLSGIRRSARPTRPIDRKSDTYIILRHPEGGRKDILRWPAQGESRRPSSKFTAPAANMARLRMPGLSLPHGWPRPVRALETAGVVDSKFGSVALLRPAGGPKAPVPASASSSGIDHPALQMSGWSCQGDSLPARRAAIDCMLNRLILLTSGNDPKLAEVFAHAELKRGGCPSATASARLDDGSRKSQVARGVLTRNAVTPAKALVFMQLFCRRWHLSDPVWPD